MSDLLPLCFLRIWCRNNNCWLSFKTKSRDRFLVNPDGYFNELPDGSLAAISPRMTFPVYDWFSSVPLETLSIRKQYGDDARFISVPLTSAHEESPRKIDVDILAADPLSSISVAAKLSKIERYILLRGMEAGVISANGLGRLMELRETHRSIGAALIYGGICQWETLLGYCMDTRPPSLLDPPLLRVLIERKEWELVGEILCAIGYINRTQLEYTLKIKREGSQALGQILTAMGAAKQDDIDHCLKIQSEVTNLQGNEVALIGKLLINQGVILEGDLEEALRNQRVARQSLGKILVSMGACSQRDIESYEKTTGRSFQSEIDDINLGNYLIKTETITRRALEEALRIQQRGRQVMGELLVSMGLCSSSQIERVLQFQKELLETHRSGVEKLGSILIHCGKVPPAKIEEAVKLQTMGRQPFGVILVALGACTAEDVNLALEIQQRWREVQKTSGDRLGEVLVQQSIITERELEAPLLEHMREERPLGQILIEQNLCSPEAIIGALIERDRTRQYDFLNFVKHYTNSRQSASSNNQDKDSDQLNSNKTNSIVNKLSSWFSRPPNT